MLPIILNNLMLMPERNAYEEQLYTQLLVTMRAHARHDELITRRRIKELQNAERNHQTPGGVTPPSPEPQEHRGDDPPAPV